jgi:hypothetical protein
MAGSSWADALAEAADGSRARLSSVEGILEIVAAEVVHGSADGTTNRAAAAGDAIAGAPSRH